VHDQLSWFWQLIQGRRSIRRYEPQPVTRHILERLLTAANWAPSAHNSQPWRFCVVEDDGIKRRLAVRMGECWRQDLLADGTDPEVAEERVATSRDRIVGAPILILACASLGGRATYSDEPRDRAEWAMALQGVALACQNLLLAAHQYGLGTCWMCAPLFVPELVREVLCLPETWHPQALITVGYSAEIRTKSRQPVGDLVIWR
jgi:F420 biosynthesis protein FbiB-like protein